MVNKCAKSGYDDYIEYTDIYDIIGSIGIIENIEINKNIDYIDTSDIIEKFGCIDNMDYPMKITVYCRKGSAGKTPIAVNIALDRGYALATNEGDNILDQIIPEDRLITIEPSERFPTFPPDIEIVFDLAGVLSREASPSITSAVEQSNVVLVPIYNELKCLNAGLSTIREILPHNVNIVVVATKLQKQKHESFSDWRDSADFKNVSNVIHSEINPRIPIFPLKFSKVFDTIFEKEKSISQLRATDMLAKYAYRDVSAQFDDLLTYVEKNHAS